jgi:hypothetical protein
MVNYELPDQLSEYILVPYHLDYAAVACCCCGMIKK